MCDVNHKIKFDVNMAKCIWRTDSCLSYDGRPKHQYDNKDDAYREINRLMEESAGGVASLRAYKCKYCEKWHLTSYKNL